MKLNSTQPPTRGGKRPGAGRKPVPENQKKIPVWLMVRREDIEALGGIENTQEIGLAAVGRALKSKNYRKNSVKKYA